MQMSLAFCLTRKFSPNLIKMIQGSNCKNCHMICGKGNVSPEILTKLDEGYEKLVNSDSKSLLKKYLTRDVFNKLRDVQTPMHSTLLDCVQSGKCNIVMLLIFNMQFNKVLKITILVLEFTHRMPMLIQFSPYYLIK